VIRGASVRLPTKEEINPFENDLDGILACRNFFGKSLDDVEVMFNENWGLYREDLLYLGPVAFHYYLPAFLKFFRKNWNEKPSYVDWFGVVLEQRLERDPAALVPVARELVEVCRLIDEKWPGPEYCDHYREVQSKYGKLTGEFMRMIAEQRNST
jgi:hypothetical protein